MMKRFKDRQDAGKQLAKALNQYANTHTVVLGLPRGGVPVAYEIAQTLHLPMNIFLVRKLGVPGNEELAFGAIAEADICVLNEPLMAKLHLGDEAMQSVIHKEKRELARRLNLYRRNKPLPCLKDKTVILVDDGIATGASLKAAVSALNQLKPHKIVIAVPIASPASVSEFSGLVDDIVCLLTPEYFYAVGQGYVSFTQTSDAEVLSLLDAV